MGLIDIHNHMMPRVDDGSKSIAMTYEMLKIAYAEGIDNIILTPHYKSGHLHVAPYEIRRFADEMTRISAEYDVPVTFHPGNEIRYYSRAIDRLEKEIALTLADSDYALIEFEPPDPFEKIIAAIKELTYAGYIPIIAHAERYRCMCEDLNNWQDVLDMGGLIQINCGSVMGKHGHEQKAYTHKLLKEQAVSFIATDAHRDTVRAPYMRECVDFIYRKCGAEYADKIIEDNPRRVLNNDDID